MNSSCYRCGSNKLVSDRALAGRLVCSVCGTPFDSSRVSQLKLNNYFRFSYTKLLMLFVLTILLIIILSP